MTAIRKLIAGAAWVGLVVALSVLALNAFVAQRNTRQLYDDAGWVDHTHQVLHGLGDVYATVLEAESNARGYMVGGGVVTGGRGSGTSATCRSCVRLWRNEVVT